jgi:FMN phosphatase YigB (HAD superfamily)
VGDSLVNDCQASKAAGARTVWLRADDEAADDAAFSTVGEEEAARRAAAADAALRSGSVDATIDTMSELPDAVDALADLLAVPAERDL